MDKWNPFKEDFEDTTFNSYSRGPGRHLPQGHVNKQDGVQLYVTGIPIQLPPEGLKNLFLQAGSVKHVKIMPSKIDGSQNTFGFVTMSNLKEATEAISRFNNFQIDRFRLRVQACQSQEERERRRRKREEDDAFLNTLNCAKNPQQYDSDDDIQTSKTQYNGINNARVQNENLKIDIPSVSLSDLDDSIIKQGPPSLKIASIPSSSNSSLSDLTIVVGNQSRLVKPTSSHTGKTMKVNGVGRGLISTDLSATEKSYRGMAQALNNKPNNPHSSLYERMTSYESTMNNGGKQCLYCCKLASSLCSRCKMPYCGIECQTADWSKHKNICAQVSVMPKDLPVEDDGFEVSLGEDIYEYLPKEERDVFKQVYGQRLTASIQRTDDGYRNFKSKVSPTHSSPKLDKISPTKHSPSQINQKSNKSPNKQSSNKDKISPSPNKSSPRQKNKEDLTISYFKDLPCKVITMNTDIQAIITFIESPDRFWVSQTTDIENAFIYSQQLEKDPGEMIKKAPVSGQLFACKYEGMWCRSQVLTLSSDSQTAKISYFDFGNVENVPLKRLHYLPPIMTTVYPLAIECRINGIYPVDIKGWPKNCMLNYIQLNSLCTVNVKQKHDNLCLVTLQGSEGVDVAKCLIDAKIAQRERCKVYSQHLRTLVEQLKPGQEINLVIVVAKSPQDFKAQIDEPTYRNTLDAFTTELDRVCEQNSTKQYRPEVNEVVSCKYVDKHWYRAVVLRVTNAAAIVYFMDYGDEQEIIQSNIQPLSGDQVDYPTQAIKCSLKDIKTFDSSVINIVDQKFSELSLKLECKYKAKVVAVQGDVAILDLFDNKGKSVSVILKDCVDQAGAKQIESSARPLADRKQSENLQQKSPSSLLLGVKQPKKLERCDTETLPLNQTVACVYASFLPNSQFCVNVLANFPILAEVMTKMNEECSRTLESYVPKIGEYVCALFQGGWYRARVLMKNGDKVTVYFLDYGNTCEVPVTEIRKINPEFLQLPAQAIHCSFHGINVPISSQQMTELESILQQDKFQVQASTVEDTVHKVVVTLPDSTNINEVILQALSESGMDVSEKQPTVSPKEETIKATEKCQSKIAEESNATSEVSIEKLPLNKPVECMFSTFLPESQFCVGLFEKFTELAEVMTEINTECAASDQSYLPKTGEYIAAMFEGGWYRAEVLNILDDKITVLFIDYGNTSDVSIKEIRKLNPKHLKLPAQAISCLFEGIDTPLSKHQLTELEGILQLDKLRVQASSVTDNVYKVTVVMSDSTNINQVLVQAFATTGTKPSGTEMEKEASKQDVQAHQVTPANETVNTPKSDIKEVQEKPTSQKSATESSNQVGPTSSNSSKVVESRSEATASTSEISIEKLPLNKPVECMFSTFLPESQFCVGLFEKFTELAEVMTEINTECAASDQSYLPKTGEYIATMFEGAWFRAEVLNILDDKITVLFIDYGNTSDVSIKEIRKLNPKHLKLPAQAIMCLFEGIDTPLSKHQLTELEGILQQGKLRVQASSVADNVYKVTVVMSNSTNINQVLVQAFATTGTKPSDTEMEKEASKQDVKAHQVTPAIETENTPKSDVKAVQEKPTSQKSATESSNQVGPASSSSSKVVESPSDPAVSTTEVSIEKLPLNKPMECMFSTFLPESQFCVCLFEKFTELAEVMTEINTECAASDQSYLPKTGEYIAAMFEGGWYRAEVLNILDDKITVLFIDYGNTSDVSIKEIRKLNPKHLKLPAQAISCLFEGIDTPLSKHQLTELEGILQQDKLRVQASSVTDNVYKVTVVMSDSTNINQVLVQAFATTGTKPSGTEMEKEASKPEVLAHQVTQATETEKTSSEPNIPESEEQVASQRSESGPPKPEGQAPQITVSTPEIPNEKLPLNQPITCIFTSFIPESRFCVGLHEKFTNLAEVMTKLNEECQATSESYLPKIGEYVCALFQQLWYRAKVLSHTEDKFNVVFIDYGNTSDVTVNEIRKLNPAHLEFPAQAITCSFDGAKALTDDQQVELESSLQSDTFTVQVTTFVDGIHKVVITLPDGSNINEVLKVAQGEIIEEPKSDKHKSDIPVTVNSSAEIRKVTPVPENMETPQEENSVPESVPQMSACDFPVDGSEVLTMFGSFISSREFCVLKADSYPTFCELSVEVNNYCTSNSTSYKPVVGECVCALYQDAWYRAQVKNIDNDKYTVFFVDYGNTQQVSSNEIRKILPNHLEFPAQAVTCCFAGLKSEIYEAQKAEVESFLSKAAFNMKIVGIQDGVHSAIVALSDGSILNDALIALLDKPQNISPSRSEIEETQLKFYELKSEGYVVPLNKSTPMGFEIQHINGICDFYVLISDSSVKDTLEMIASELSRVKPEEYKPMKGEYVSCLFEGEWYRALVIDITSDANYDVLFIDYGNTSQVTSSSVRQFTSKLASIPPLALHCSLFNVIDKGQESLVKFAEFLTSNHDLKMTLIEKKNEIYLVNVMLSSGQCLNDEFRPKSQVRPTSSPSDILQEKLPQDQQVACFFSCFLQDSIFCVSLYKSYSHLAEMMNTLNAECAATPESYLPKIGEHVCALYQNMWYRAKVLNVNDDKFTVVFIDYGNTSDLTVKEIRKLNPSLLDLPAQALKCSFYGVNIPLDLDHQAKIEAMLQQDVINIQASSTVDEIYKVFVTLSDGSNINDIIIKAVSGSTKSEENPQKTNDSKTVEPTVDTTPTPKRESQQYKVSDMKFVVPSDNELPVIFTHVIDPDNIYCHSASEGSTEAMIALSELCKTMADYCEKSIMDVEPMVDHLYCALMGEDWYRAVLKEVRNDKVLIQYIDIGEEKEIMKYNLRPFLPEFMNLPVYTFKCAVNGVKPIGERWGTGTGHLITSFTGDKNRLKVVCREEKLLYCDVQVGPGQTDLKTELITQCLGVQKPNEPQPVTEEDEEEVIRRQIAELQAKLASKLKT